MAQDAQKDEVIPGRTTLAGISGPVVTIINQPAHPGSRTLLRWGINLPRVQRLGGRLLN